MKKTKEVIVEEKQYQCFCTKCSNSWTSTGKPRKCPDCGSKAITYSDLKNKNSKKGIVFSLRLSTDGKSIVDHKGKEVARFREGLRVRKSPKGGGQKLPGHMECWDECIAYDQNGKCVKSIRTCQWVFDPI